MKLGYSVTAGETQLSPAVVVATIFLILVFAIGLVRQAVLLL